MLILSKTLKTKIVDYYVSEFVSNPDESNNTVKSLEKLVLILQKYLLCIKSQQNLNSVNINSNV
jgi:hypothetical protein